MVSVRSFILIMLPFVLVIAAGTLIRNRGDPDTTERRYFLFLIWTAVGLLAGIFIYDWLGSGAGYGFATLLAPIITGVMALIFLHLRDLPSLRSKDKALVLVALILLLGLAAVPLWAGIVAGDQTQAEMVFIILAILAVSGILAAAWTLGRRYPTALGLAALVVLALFNGLGMAQQPLLAQPPPAWRPVLSVAVYLALPGLVVSTVAILAATGLKLLPPSSESGPLSWRSAVWRLALAALLLGAYVFTYAWVWLWDGTNDGLRTFSMVIVSGVTATAAALVLGMTAAGWRRWVGLAFPLLLVGLMAGGVSIRWRGVTQPTHQVTEARAARIQEAVERFQATTGSYPTELAELVPGELWWISPPVIIQGQGWCYQGGADYYRLGAIYREHWSAPSITVRMYASAGNPPETGWGCDEKLAELKPQYDMAGPGTAPTPEPLSTSATPGERIAVQPTVSAPSIVVGSWSPDGAFLVFGLTEYSGEQTAIELHFLKAETGEVCRASEPEWTAGWKSDGLREHFAWLPDGRLLYVSEAGEMVAMSPCADGVEDLGSRFPATFAQALSFDAQSGRVLLKTQDAYWLLDGDSLEAREISGIAPNWLESNRGWYAWSPGLVTSGARLAISLLDGQGADDGGTLFIVDGMTGTVERSLPLEEASEENLPWIEWLTRDELLVHGAGMLRVLDLRSDPPQMIDLLRDIFLLEVAYPDDFSSMDSISNPAGDGYILGVRVNHPRNQGVYVYASGTDQVEVFQHDTHTLLFFPGGQWMRLLKWEDDPSYRDEYEMVWMDRPGETQRLMVEGHTPRSHPQIFPKYLPASSQLVFSSSQGVSLVSLPDGETITFWELMGGEGFSSIIYPSPGGEGLVVKAAGDGLYYLPLPPNG